MCSKEDPPSCSQATPPRFSGFSNPSAAANPAFSLSTSSPLQGAPSLRSPPPCLYFLLDPSGSLGELWSIACWGPGRLWLNRYQCYRHKYNFGSDPLKENKGKLGNIWHHDGSFWAQNSEHSLKISFYILSINRRREVQIFQGWGGIYYTCRIHIYHSFGVTPPRKLCNPNGWVKSTKSCFHS